jgi:intracellular septation protein
MTRMQALFDFLPLLIFLAAYLYGGIYIATGALMAAMLASVTVQYARHRTVSKMLLTSTILVLVFGGITLVLRDPIFFQWKPTIVNLLFAGAFLGSQIFGERTLTERMMGHAIELDRALWRQLNLLWVGTFVFLAIANLVVLYNFDEQTWAFFKVFGSLGITFAMVALQAVWISIKTNGQASQPESTD